MTADGREQRRPTAGTGPAFSPDGVPGRRGRGLRRLVQRTLPVAGRAPAGAATRLLVAHTADLEPALLDGCEQLLRTVFADAGDPLDGHDWEHCLGGMHAVVVAGDEPVAHGAVVLRRLLHGGRALRCGYVEGVAVAASHRGRGHFAAVMGALERVVHGGFQLGALGSTDQALPRYLARGWAAWPGPLGVLTPSGVVPTPDEQGAVLVLPGAAPLDRSVPLVADWRDGEVW